MRKHLLWLVPLISIFASGLVSIYMWQLSQSYELWDRLPLYLFVFLWLGISSIIQFRSKNASKGLFLFLSTASGVFLALGFPPLQIPIFIFLGFVPLLVLENQLSQGNLKYYYRDLLWYSYHAFVVWNILSTWWVANTALAAGIVAIWLNAFLMCVPILLFAWTKSVLPKVAYASFIGYWLVFEWVHLNWELSWVWLNLGNSFSSWHSWIQWYSYTGVFGGSLWVLLVNYLIYKLFQTRNCERKISLFHLLRISLLILIPASTSLYSYYNYKEVGSQVNVILGQPNYEPHYEKFTISEPKLFDELFDHVSSAVTDSTDYFILPETVVDNVDEENPVLHPLINRLQMLANDYPRLKIISGVSAYKFIRNPEDFTPNTRTRISSRTGSPISFESLNAAIQLDNNSFQNYRKSKFVPGAEIFPYSSLFFFAKPLIDKLDGTIEGLGSQKNRSLFINDQKKVAPIICYESMYGAYSAEYTLRGANFFTIMTNDGWWDNTAGHKQHLEFARLRAIENRRDIARSANTGISAFINQRGDIVAKTSYGEKTTLSGKVYLNEELTFYSQWRDFIARIALLTSFLFLINTIVKSFMKRKELKKRKEVKQ